MRRRWVVPCLLIAVVAIMTLAGAGCHRPADGAKPLIWAADQEGGAPYVFKDPKDPNKIIGFEVEIAEAISKELGRPIEFKQYEFSSLVPGLDREDFDFAMNGLEITPDRKVKLRFSRPYYVYRLQLVARADEKRFNNLKELQDLKEKMAGTLEDTAASRLLDKLVISKKIYSDSVAPYTDLELGRVDAVLQDLPIADALAKKNAKLKYVGEPVEPGYYAIAFNPKNEALAQQVDVALEKLIKDGTLRKIYEKWGLWNDDQKELEKAKP